MSAAKTHPVPGVVRFVVDDDHQIPGYRFEGEDQTFYLNPSDAFAMLTRLAAALAAVDGGVVTAPGLRALTRFAVRDEAARP